jgi:hypothetical protein
MPGYIYISLSNLSQDEEREFQSIGVGSIKQFRRTGETGYSIRVEVSTSHAGDAVENLRAM